MQDEGDLFNYKTYSAIDFVIGLFITLGASIINAAGLNITKLDFTRQEALPSASRTADWKRGLWWLGLTLYIASQLIGSTLALEYLRAEYVAPLGSTSLIFNFIFAYLLVGTPVTKTDILGTVIIVLGVIGVVLFGNARTASDFDKESNLSLSLLKEIWGRGDWIVYLTFLEVTTLFSFWFSQITHEVCMARVEDERGEEGERVMGDGGRRKVEVGWRAYVAKVGEVRGRVRRKIKGALETWSQSRPDSTIRKAAGLCWSLTGGLLAGQTLVFAKSAVKLVTSAISHSDVNEANQFTSPLSWLIVGLLVVAAVSQIWCLNKALKCYDSTFTVPIFFATYTTCGFINSLIYLDELHTYRLWVFLCIWASIGVLIIGVVLLSTKKSSSRPRAASVLREEGAPGDNFDGANPSNPPLASPVVELPTLKKGQGWLTRVFPVGSSSSAPGEITQRDRRRQKGLTMLDEGDGDSMLGSEAGGSVARDLEMDEVDALGKFEPSTLAFSEQDEDEFGDFKAAERVET